MSSYPTNTNIRISSRSPISQRATRNGWKKIEFPPNVFSVADRFAFAQNVSASEIILKTATVGGRACLYIR